MKHIVLFSKLLKQSSLRDRSLLHYGTFRLFLSINFMASSDLNEYIAVQRSQGVGDDQIRSVLLTKGWKQSLIDEAFGAEKKTTVPSSGHVGIFQAFTLVITNPRQLFMSVRTAPLKDAAFYLSVFVLVPAIVNLSTTAVYLGVGTWMVQQSLAVVGMCFVMLFIMSGLTHGACRLLRGSGTYTNTLKAIIYGSTPSLAVNILGMLLGIVGLVGGGYSEIRMVGMIAGLIAAVWSLITIARGLMLYHAMSGLRVVVALIVPILVSLLAIAIFFIYFFLGFF